MDPLESLQSIEPPVTRLCLEDSLVDFFLSRGFNFAFCSFWVSQWDPQSVNLLQGRFLEQDFPLLQLGSVKLEPTRIGRPRTYPFIENGRVSLRAGIENVMVQGSHLRIVLGGKEESSFADAPYFLSRCVNEIRFRFGIKSAVAEIYRAHENLLSRECVIPSGPFTAWRGYSVDNSSSTCVSGGHPWGEMQFGKEALLLLDVGFRANSLSERFIWLWMALESMTGKGPRLKQFFQSRGGVKLAALVSALSKSRGKYAHRGKDEIRGQDVAAVFELIRIAALKTEEQRRAAIVIAEASMEQA